MNYIDYFTSYEYKFKRFVNDNVDSLSFNRNDLKPNVSKKNLQTRIQEDKLFLATSTDGKNDGKLSSKEKAKAFFGGMVNHFVGFLDDTYEKIKENPRKTIGIAVLAAGIGVAGISAVGAPIVVGVTSAIGLFFGIKDIVLGTKSIIEGIQKQKNAKTDADAKQAFYDIGGGAGEFAEGAISVGISASGIHYSCKNFKKDSFLVKSTDDFLKNLEQFFNRTSIKDISPSEAKALKACNRNKRSIYKTLSFLGKEYTDYQRKSLISYLDPNSKYVGKFGLGKIFQGSLVFAPYPIMSSISSSDFNKALSAKYMV